MKRTLLTTIDTTITAILFVLFIYHTLVVSGVNMGNPNTLFILSEITLSSLPLILIGFLVCLLRKENVFDNIYPIQFNKSFRVMIVIQLFWYTIMWKDSFVHPLAYNFNRYSLRRSVITDLPLYIWLLRVYFKRLIAIENKCI